MKRNWKNMLAIILALVLTGNDPVYAKGLSGIDFGNNKETGEDEKTLPDPYEISGDYGSLNQEDYEPEEGYICDIYQYSLPDDLEAFADGYQELAEEEGYTAEWETMDDYEVCTISDGQSIAYLFILTEENGMMLFVEQGMSFQLEEEPDKTYDTEKNAGSGSESSNCSYCDNSGFCPKCDGLGDCEECFGNGTVSCPTCSGNGKCQTCWGTKGEKVYVFGGENEWVECAACDGTGNCGTCDGNRKVTCSVCGGSGDCTLCSGTKICPYCGGASAIP